MPEFAKIVPGICYICGDNLTSKQFFLIGKRATVVNRRVSVSKENCQLGVVPWCYLCPRPLWARWRFSGTGACTACRSGTANRAFLMTTTQTIVGHWNVVEQQRRNRGEWIHEYDYQTGDWKMNFYPNGRMSEDFNVAGHPRDLRSGEWARDPNSGLILFKFDDIPLHCDDSVLVFDPADDGPWLYFLEDAPHIRPDCEAIIAHHAFLRHRLCRRG